MRGLFKYIVAIALFSYLLPDVAQAQQIELLNTFPIYTHETIKVRVSGVPNRDRDSTQRFWITLVAQDARVGTWKQYFWVDDGGGDFEFRALAVGNYEIRLHDHYTDRPNSWETVYALSSFEVIHTPPTPVSVEFLTPSPVSIYSPINVRINNLEPRLKYWVTIVSQGTSDGRWDRHQNMQGARSQSIEFDGYEPGDYELRVHDYRSGVGIVARAPFTVSWDVSSASVVPSCPRLYDGRSQKLVCKCDQIPTGGLWGTDIYTTGSSPCLAAIHAGAIPPFANDISSSAVVVVEAVPGKQNYQGSFRNGIQSKAYSNWEMSFVVHGAGQYSSIDPLALLDESTQNCRGRLGVGCGPPWDPLITRNPPTIEFPCGGDDQLVCITSQMSMGSIKHDMCCDSQIAQGKDGYMCWGGRERKGEWKICEAEWDQAKYDWDRTERFPYTWQYRIDDTPASTNTNWWFRVAPDGVAVRQSNPMEERVFCQSNNVEYIDGTWVCGAADNSVSTISDALENGRLGENESRILSPLQGEWRSSEFRYAFIINGTVGHASQTNSRNFSVGEVILIIDDISIDGISGSQIYTDGNWYPISIEMIGDNVLRLSGDDVVWTMTKVSSD